MVFTSPQFVFFISVFFLLYWYVFNKTLKFQNLLILVGSYFFYAYWDWHFLFLLIGSSLLNFFLGIWISESTDEKRRKFLVGVGLVQGLGCLLYFKYCNFFIASFIAAFSALHIHLDIHTLNIVLPIGISFYTFKAISYLLDINKGKISATTDWVVFFSYIAFFPCFLSGPIDRPNLLIPQLETKRDFNYAQASDGMRQILWGVFKKLVIADNCAPFTGDIFGHYQTSPASALLFCAFLYTVQVYADFSGYSDIAIGVSNLLGFKVTRNFNFPFFAQNIADFWRRWHISLTSWLTEYLFTPLSIYFRDYGKTGIILAIVINFTIVGIWHGANWTFIFFGFLHGCLFIPLILQNKMNKKVAVAKNQPITFTIVKNILLTFLLLMFTFIIFGAGSITQVFGYYRGLFSVSMFSSFPIVEKTNMIGALLGILILFTAEWLQRDKQHALQIDFIKPFVQRALIYIFLIAMVLTFKPTESKDFIYFKF